MKSNYLMAFYMAFSTKSWYNWLWFFATGISLRGTRISYGQSVKYISVNCAILFFCTLYFPRNVSLLYFTTFFYFFLFFFFFLLFCLSSFSFAKTLLFLSDILILCSVYIIMVFPSEIGIPDTIFVTRTVLKNTISEKYLNLISNNFFISIHGKNQYSQYHFTCRCC